MKSRAAMRHTQPRVRRNPLKVTSEAVRRMFQHHGEGDTGRTRRTAADVWSAVVQRAPRRKLKSIYVGSLAHAGRGASLISR